MSSTSDVYSGTYETYDDVDSGFGPDFVLGRTLNLYSDTDPGPRPYCNSNSTTGPYSFL